MSLHFLSQTLSLWLKIVNYCDSSTIIINDVNVNIIFTEIDFLFNKYTLQKISQFSSFGLWVYGGNSIWQFGNLDSSSCKTFLGFFISWRLSSLRYWSSFMRPSCWTPLSEIFPFLARWSHLSLSLVAKANISRESSVRYLLLTSDIFHSSVRPFRCSKPCSMMQESVPSIAVIFSCLQLEHETFVVAFIFPSVELEK